MLYYCILYYITPTLTLDEFGQTWSRKSIQSAQKTPANVLTYYLFLQFTEYTIWRYPSIIKFKKGLKSIEGFFIIFIYSMTTSNAGKHNRKQIKLYLT